MSLFKPNQDKQFLAQTNLHYSMSLFKLMTSNKSNFVTGFTLQYVSILNYLYLKL